MYYKDTEEKDQMIISHVVCFCHTGVKFENAIYIYLFNRIKHYLSLVQMKDKMVLRA